MTIHLYNTLTRRKEALSPIDAKNVRMYVCGPTVYDRPHIGNARSVVVYDVLYRLLCHVYGKEHVTYVRNITDVDDKINARAKELSIAIQALTSRTSDEFHADMAALNCLSPNKEPRATEHIKQMIAINEKLIANGHAYVSQGHVLFAVDSYKEYGQLSGRKLDELVAGARVEVESYKKHPGDFVLWKPADEGDDASSVFDSPWGKGRPGWHIECSAMSSTYLGNTFDIHGGGADLMFPHHENEIAQSRCSDKSSQFAKLWVHNGFLTVNGEKMSKSLGNFITVKDLLDKGVRGEVIRLAFLMTKYNEPLDWNDKLLSDAKSILDHWYRQLGMNPHVLNENPESTLSLSSLFMMSLMNDLNTPAAISDMYGIDPYNLCGKGRMLGLFTMTPEEWFKGGTNADRTSQLFAAAAALGLDRVPGQDLAKSEEELINRLIVWRSMAKAAKNWPQADRIRKALADQGILLEDRPDGTTDWRRA